MNTSLELSGLVDCLSHVPPVALSATALLRELRQTETGDWFPAVSPERLTEATCELIAYTKSCATLVAKLQHLAPVTLPTLDCGEWPL